MPPPYTFHTRSARLSGDETTPVRLYRAIRTYFSPSVLLESNNFEQARDTHSVIAFDPLVELRQDGDRFTETYYPTAEHATERVTGPAVVDRFLATVEAVDYVGDPGAIDGFFGFTSFDAYRFVEPEVAGPAPANAPAESTAPPELPDLHYLFFRFVLVFDHFHEHYTVTEFVPPGEDSRLDDLLALLRRPLAEAAGFACEGAERSNLTDAEYEAFVRAGKRHCDRGDTFQLVLSREYAQTFTGDDFNVYRQLRRLNPSPYCYYFDFGAYRMLGASPEALLTVRDGRATMRPIAGTYAVTGDADRDAASARALAADPKENAEHLMLVDLARNDLSRSCYPVRVDVLQRIERYSHLMHIVSQVSGRVEGTPHPYRLYAECFPAGTLSGAPKFKAIELIYRYEGARRGAYGGGLGYVSPRGGFDHCIVIRTAVAQGNTLRFRAGAGIVSASDVTAEREEVVHKTNALREALRLADAAAASAPTAPASPTA